MSENIEIPINASKEQIYESLIPQITALVEGEPNIIANLANIAAALKQTFDWWWVGFYLVEGNELVLGPFQGPVACTRIKQGKGVCGSAWATRKAILVPDVEKFPGHIACSSASVAEIVVPVFDKNNEVVAVLDVDSERYDVLDETDCDKLVHLADAISKVLFQK